MAFDSFPYRQKEAILSVLNLPLLAKSGNFEPKIRKNLADSIIFPQINQSSKIWKIS